MLLIKILHKVGILHSHDVVRGLLKCDPNVSPCFSHECRSEGHVRVRPVCKKVCHGVAVGSNGTGELLYRALVVAWKMQEGGMGGWASAKLEFEQSRFARHDGCCQISWAPAAWLALASLRLLLQVVGCNSHSGFTHLR